MLLVASAGCFHLREPEQPDADRPDGREASIDATDDPADAGPPDVMLSEVTITLLDDTYVRLANPTFNYGAAEKICADLDDARVMLLRFDVSPIPGGSTVVGAELGIFTSNTAASDGSVNPYDVHAMLEPWIEGALAGAAGQASWNERAPGTAWTAVGAGPGSRSTDVAGTFTPTLPDTEYFAPLVPDVVQHWVSAPQENYGLAIVATTTDGACFNSVETADATKRPSLRVSVKLP